MLNLKVWDLSNLSVKLILYVKVTCTLLLDIYQHPTHAFWLHPQNVCAHLCAFGDTDRKYSARICADDVNMFINE